MVRVCRMNIAAIGRLVLSIFVMHHLYTNGSIDVLNLIVCNL